jgi:hypothetical protein
MLTSMGLRLWTCLRRMARRVCQCQPLQQGPPATSESHTRCRKEGMQRRPIWGSGHGWAPVAVPAGAPAMAAVAMGLAVPTTVPMRAPTAIPVGAPMVATADQGPTVPVVGLAGALTLTV